MSGPEPNLFSARELTSKVINQLNKNGVKINKENGEIIQKAANLVEESIGPSLLDTLSTAHYWSDKNEVTEYVAAAPSDQNKSFEYELPGNFDIYQEMLKLLANIEKVKSNGLWAVDYSKTANEQISTSILGITKALQDVAQSTISIASGKIDTSQIVNAIGTGLSTLFDSSASELTVSDDSQLFLIPKSTVDNPEITSFAGLRYKYEIKVVDFYECGTKNHSVKWAFEKWSVAFANKDAIDEIIEKL